jgi:hypothetical protein
MTLHTNRAMAIRLSEIVNYYRNPSAHGTPISISKYHKFIEEYYGKRLIHDLIDTMT